MKNRRKNKICKAYIYFYKNWDILDDKIIFLSKIIVQKSDWQIQYEINLFKKVYIFLKKYIEGKRY